MPVSSICLISQISLIQTILLKLETVLNAPAINDILICNNGANAEIRIQGVSHVFEYFEHSNGNLYKFSTQKSLDI